MAQNLQFLSLDIRTSIAELRACDVPERAIELLITRIIRDGEEKTSRLQQAIIQIEEHMQARLDAIDASLLTDLHALQTSFDERAPLLAHVSADLANVRHAVQAMRERWPEIEALLDAREQAVGR
jgi:hypothetical protein